MKQFFKKFLNEEWLRKRPDFWRQYAYTWMRTCRWSCSVSLFFFSFFFNKPSGLEGLVALSRAVVLRGHVEARKNIPFSQLCIRSLFATARCLFQVALKTHNSERFRWVSMSFPSEVRVMQWPYALNYFKKQMGNKGKVLIIAFRRLQKILT